MKKNVLSLGLLLFAPAVFASCPPCPLGPNGINQWRLIYQVGQCVNTSTGILCSKIDALTPTCDVCSELEVIESKIDILSGSFIESIVDVLISTSDACCSTLESQLTSLTDMLSTQGDACCSTLSTLIVSSTDVITSTLDNLNVSIDDSAILSSLDVCCSTLDQQIDSSTDFISSEIEECCTGLESRLDVLASKAELLESILDALTTQPQGFISCFGDALSVGRDEYISINFQYGVDGYDTTTTTANGGTLLSTNSMMTLSTGVNIAGSVILQSKRALHYRPGHEGYAFFTASFLNGGAANSRQWIGLFDSIDGMAVGYNGATFSTLLRRNGVDTIVPQASFNVDPLDGTGPSGITIDPTKINIFRISYGWLGVATIKYEIFRADCTWHTFQEVEWANTNVTPHLSNPVLPIRAEAVNTGNNTDLRLASASWNAGVLGDFTHVAQRIFSVINVTDKAVGMTEIPLISIRSNATYNSIPNKIDSRLYTFGGGDFGTGSARILLRLRKGATLGGAAFASVDANSVMSFDTAATTTTGGTFLLLGAAVNNANGPTMIQLSDNDTDIYILPGETLTLTAQAASGSGGGSNVKGYLNWAELF